VLQAREFNERASLTGVIVTKLDGTPKGGVVVAIKDDLGVPIRYVGVGEGMGDLKLFDAQEFVDVLFSKADSGPVVNGEAVGRGPLRRRRHDVAEL